MSIPIILDRAQKVAGQHSAARYPGGLFRRVPLDQIEVVMQDGFLRPRYFVAFPLPARIESPGVPQSVLDELRGHLFEGVKVMIPLRGSRREWDVYQGWLSGREYEIGSELRSKHGEPVFGITGSGRGREI